MSLTDEYVTPRPLSEALRVWKTIKLGVHKTPEAYYGALKQANVAVHWREVYRRPESPHIPRIGDAVCRISCEQEVTEVDLVKVSASELLRCALLDDVTRDIVFTRGLQLGLQLCRAEVGPALRLAYLNQPWRAILRVAMENITYHDYLDPEQQGEFILDNHGDKLWLETSYLLPGHLCRGINSYVFEKPRKK